MALPTKLVLVIRADLPAASAVSAAAVLGLSVGGRLPVPSATEDEAADAGVSPHPVSVLSAAPEQLRELYAKARATEDLITVGFDEVEIGHVAVAVFGPGDRVTALTERLSLHGPGPAGYEGAGGRRRRGGMFPAVDDRRFSSPATGDERWMLVDVLRAQRATLEMKCSGLDAALSHRSVEPSTLSLLGLVRHLADVERRWFRRVLGSQDVQPLFSSPADPDGDFDGAVPDPAVVAAAWEAWRAEVAFADGFVADAPDLDIEGDDAWRGRVSLRWVLIHMIEEYARHNGHADLLRERIDGTIGV
ncbi:MULTISPECIES: DUF664 domain-containing protein [unclassified Nonomuraea]|uniref:mycothiol transferase n=1 Tax=unclassified Nonomuraea TaxID=2593643 RepID=UPI0033FDF616